MIDSEQYFQLDPLTAPFVLEAFKRYAEGDTMKDRHALVIAVGIPRVAGAALAAEIGPAVPAEQLGQGMDRGFSGERNHENGDGR